jgi:acetyl-CoA/propionyl-CoA carboxylase biotin carboxyl carrier protein
VGAGTIEFLVDVKTQEFYFLEMNTRLQVEHGVTELVTGVDIVEAQLAVASGEPLRLAQEDVVLRGHAVEARIVAEDPYAGFLPSPGMIRELRVSQSPWLRADLGVESGDVVASGFDPMFGKLLAWGPDRDVAIRRLRKSIGEFVAEGVVTVLPYLSEILRAPSFVAVEHSTTSVEQDWTPDASSATAVDGRRAIQFSMHSSEPSAREICITTLNGDLRLTVHGIAKAGSGSLANESMSRGVRGANHGSGRVSGEAVAPMDALVVQVLHQIGSSVERGDVLVVLEAMKMEFEIKAARDGVVSRVHVAEGDSVRAGARLVDLKEV